MGFRVGLSSDLSNGAGGFSWGNIAIEELAPLTWDFLQPTGAYFQPDVVRGFDAIAFTGPGVVADSFPAPEESPLIIARFGVGYDNIDLDACTRAVTALTITPDGSKKPVATAALMMVLSTMHRLVAKDALARAAGWDKRLQGLGQGLNGKTVATIGLGNIATEFFRLIAPFDCERIACDPWKSQEEASQHGVTLFSLDEVMKRADVVVVMATLTPETRHMIGAPQLQSMKSNAIIVNISRGPIIDESALVNVLTDGAIAGAGLDVFEVEPAAKDNPLLALENVIVTPHNIAWTDELAYNMGQSAFNSIKTISRGEIPTFVVNKDVLTTPQFLAKLEKLK